MNSDRPNNNENPTDAEQDLAKLFHYPAIGELFGVGNDSRLDEFCGKLSATRDRLESIIRYGKGSDADSAARAAKSIEVTLDFLQKLREMRRAAK